ncbi:3-oxoacyl-ACP reductase [Paucibacter sp. DJ2R-2]|uniref:3-oxoacyl-ACP reductase n=1 Tax=Paucibacter sp. DJ2R-2 TaxID=2893558 RepID=UPI0021E45E13|nr:3-oxoacyl-ACP reductase [Paucibacter sp. DJ2R-2]MCV2422893.1 3-oxoacyl-ACP reductase [Paucibacter sp. DJ4R-1]MCV2440789.1 3-oxoacyl-ACP reductase [Paucibacter sp. DJ2R-2]
MASTSDPLIGLAAGRLTGPLVRALGLPRPRALRRETGPYRGDELRGRRLVLAAMPGGHAGESARGLLQALGASLVLETEQASDATARVDIAVFDATGCREVASLAQLRSFFAPLLRRLAPCAKLLLLAPCPLDAARISPEAAAAAQGIEGFVRSLAKELGRSHAATVNALQVPAATLGGLLGPLRFFCSSRSAYVSGRILRLDAGLGAPAALEVPMVPGRLREHLAVVTGAARGLGAATAERLAEEGARVLCIDVPSAEPHLRELARRIQGDALSLDITRAAAPTLLCDWLRQHPGMAVDVLVHNAGITRDRSLFKMSEAEWSQVMAVNLQAILAIDGALDQADLLAPGAREICLSSISGIAGNAGQTNYAASKSALIGYVAARSTLLASRGATINAVAPGFIETDMTRQIPWFIREAGRRLNALSQGGQPRDVAEAVAFLALPESGAVRGQTLRVCGQALMGA